MEGLQQKEFKIFINSLFAVVLPIALQQLMTSLLNMIDIFMISSLGEEAVAALGIANRVFFILMLILFGTYSGFAIFTSQYYGSKNYQEIKKIIGVGYIAGSIPAILFCTLSLIFSPQIISFFSNDPIVIELGSDYLRIVSVSFIFTALSLNISGICRSIGRVKLPAITNVIAILINTLLNFLLIFGIGDFPALGVKGAAIGTLVARIVEFIILLSTIYLTKDNITNASIKELLSFDFSLVKKLYSRSIFVLMNELFWSLGITMFTVAYGIIGTTSQATMQIVETLNSFIFVFSMGVGNASAILIGQKLGENNIPLAQKYGSWFLRIGIVVAVIMALFSVLAMNIVALVFNNLDGETISNIQSVLKVQMLFLLPIVWNTMLIIGILRSGGDTFAAMLIELIPLWLVAVPTALIGASAFNLSLPVLFFFIKLEEVIKLSFLLNRYFKKKWLKNLTTA